MFRVCVFGLALTMCSVAGAEVEVGGGRWEVGGGRVGVDVSYVCNTYHG